MPFSLRVLLASLELLILLTYTNLLTVAMAGIGFFVYVVLYSLWKSHTIYGTAIGSIAGAVPPVVGYCAVSNQFDAGALILFMMLVLWQMPHFFSIALYHFDDYVAAEIPVLPVLKGSLRTKVHMTVYILGFIGATILLTLFHYTGYKFLIASTLISICWLLLCLRGFNSANDQVWARKMFRLSLAIITLVSVVIPLDITS